MVELGILSANLVWVRETKVTGIVPVAMVVEQAQLIMKWAVAVVSRLLGKASLLTIKMVERYMEII